MLRLPCSGSGQAHRWKGSKPGDVFTGTLWWGKAPANPQATMWTRTPVPRPFVTFSSVLGFGLWGVALCHAISWSSTRLLGPLRPRPEYDCARRSPDSRPSRSRRSDVTTGFMAQASGAGEGSARSATDRHWRWVLPPPAGLGTLLRWLLHPLLRSRLSVAHATVARAPFCWP